MTNDPTTTTLTRWAVLLSTDDDAGLAFTGRGWFASYDTARAYRDDCDVCYERSAPHRVVRVDITITDPAPAEEGQG